MSYNIINNFLSNEDISFILNLPEVHNAKTLIDEKISGKVDFTVSLPLHIKNALFQTFGINVETFPMRWIKGDTKPHFDVGNKEFTNTYLTYLSDSIGEFIINNEIYPITKGTAFVFNEGLYHETKNTGIEPRLLLGPMSEEGFAVGFSGTVITGPSNSSVYIKQENGIIYYSYDQNNWVEILNWPTKVYNYDNDPTSTFNIEFITDITLNNEYQIFLITSDYVRFGLKSLNNNGLKRRVYIDNVVNYQGLFQNWFGGPGRFYNYIYNIEVIAINGSTISNNSGWLCQQYYSTLGTNNYIINCSSTGEISTGSGGIVGANAAAMNGELFIIGCSSSGAIYSEAGGIVGSNAGINGNNTKGIVRIKSCYAYGSIVLDSEGNGAGGIIGSNSGKFDIENCYYLGNIQGTNSGGIVGSNPCAEGLGGVTNCYSRGNIMGTNAGGICGAINQNSCNFSIANCYTTGLINGTANAGGILGYVEEVSNTTISISGCYIVGQTTGNIGYIIGGTDLVDGDNSNGILVGFCYSENFNGGVDWNDSNAQTRLSLSGSVTYPSNAWFSTGINTPYELFNMGFTSYSTTNILETSLIRTYSETIEAGNSTSSGIYLGEVLYTILYSTGPNSITINESTGVLTASSNTNSGTYTLYIYNTSSYNITTFILTVINNNNNNNNNNNFPVQNLHFNNLQSNVSFYAASKIGSLKGRGSAQRIYNYCKNRNNNSESCQFLFFI
jgi:hypothetical protein